MNNFSRHRRARPSPSTFKHRLRATVAKVAVGQSLREFLPLLSGEERLLQACQQGAEARLGTQVPDGPNDALRVRAPFLRFLLLGGDKHAPVHERGVRLRGAVVEGQLDLAGCRIPLNIVIKQCKFTDSILAQDARVQGSIALEGSFLPKGINADRLQCDGSLFLRDKFKAAGEVRLLGAQIGGDLSCAGGQFEVKDGVALWADGVVVKGSVFLENGFNVTGEVRLLGPQIDGNLSCVGGQFEVKDGDALSADGVVVKGNVFLDEGFKATGGVRLLGAQIDGDLSCRGGQFEVKNGNGISLNRTTVYGVWFFTELQPAVCVDASHMQVAVLVDDIDAWAKGSVLDGLRYGAFGGGASTKAEERQNWLLKQADEHLGKNTEGMGFRPHPWRQLQHVLREMGHMEDARQIGIAFEEQLRKADLIGTSASRTNWLVAHGKRSIARAAHVLFGWLAGYGYRPMRIVLNMLLVWLICGIAYWFLALPPSSAIGPSDPLVFQNARYAACVPNTAAAASAMERGAQHAGNWYLCEPLPAEYATFSPMAYSLDIILPLVDLGQEKQWGPLIATPNSNVWKELSAVSLGHVVRFLIWFETMFGWVGSLLLVGIVSGFARRTEE